MILMKRAVAFTRGFSVAGDS